MNGPAAVPAKRRGDELNIQAEVYAVRTDLEQNWVTALPSGEILTTGEDKFIKKYRQPEQLLAKVDFKSKVPIPSPLDEIEAHDLKILCWKSNGRWLVSGGADGTVQIRETSNLSQVKSYKVVGWKEENLGWVAASRTGGVYAGSHDGCFQVWRGGEQVLGDQHKIEQASFKKLPKDRQTKYFQVMIEQEYLQRMKDVISGKKKVQLEKLAKIKLQLKDLLIENDRHDELERLNRDQFAIDLESREKTAQIGRE